MSTTTARVSMIVAISMTTCLSCLQTKNVSKMPAPAYPLCIIEEDPHKSLVDRMGSIRPLPIKQVLLIPFFMAPNRQRFIACPFVYHPGDPIVLPKERMPKQSQYEGIIVLCGDYLPTSVNSLFPDTDMVNDKKSQVIEVAKARDNDEALRILEDWATLLNSESFSVASRFDVLKETTPEKGRYAKSKELFYPVIQKYTVFFIWPYDIGTVIKVELSAADKAIVDEFIVGEKKNLLKRK